MAGATITDSAIVAQHSSNSPDSNVQMTPKYSLPSDRLFLDFCGSGESADICSPLIAQLAIEDQQQLACSFPSSCATIPEFGSYQQNTSQCGPLTQNSQRKAPSRKKYRVGRLEGLKMAHIWCQEYKGRLLRKAVQTEDIPVIKELLNEGVLADNCDDKQRTALHLASVKGNTTIVELLLNNGANPNCKDVNQNTPLMLASLSRNIPTITLLLKKGANPNLCDSKGNNALTIAQNRLTHLQQCQVACDYLRDELVHVITMIKEFVHQKEVTSSRDQLCNRLRGDHNITQRGQSSISSSVKMTSDEIQIEAMISRLSFSNSESSHNSLQTQTITQQVADEFQELLTKFNSQVKLS